MVDIKCKTKDGILITDVTPFQGKLKKRTVQDIDDLKQSILTEGLLMPFAVWKHEGKNFLLDGHGRHEALIQLAVEDPSILTSPIPCIYIDAETEDDARKALLQITSSYGKITKQGAKAFMISIPDYKAPSVSKFIPKAVVTKPVVKQEAEVVMTHKVLKIRVPNDKVDEVVNIFNKIDFIEVL